MEAVAKEPPGLDILDPLRLKAGAEAAATEAWIEHAKPDGSPLRVLEIISVYLAGRVLDVLKVPPPRTMTAGHLLVGTVADAAAWGGVSSGGKATQAVCARLRGARKVSEDARIYACCRAARRETVAVGDLSFEVVEPTCFVGSALRALEKLSLPPPAAAAVREAFAARTREITSVRPESGARWFGVPTDMWIAAQVEIARETGNSLWSPPAVSLYKSLQFAKQAATIETGRRITESLREWTRLQLFSLEFSTRESFGATALEGLLSTPAALPPAEDAAFWA